MTNQLGQIQHIVQVMLENRSFDHMLGFLYADAGNISPLGHPFDGLTGEEFNPDDTGAPVKVFKIQATDPNCYRMPGADPGEGFQNTNMQLFSADPPPPGAIAKNQGFVINFKGAIASDSAQHYTDTLPGAQASGIMGMYTPELLPVLSALAKGFAVCDAWFASVPSETLPNRGFASAATSQGHLDDHTKIYTCPSIYGRMQDKGLDWTIYGYSKSPLTKLDFPDTQAATASHSGLFADFKTRAAAGTLAAYSFLEPEWSANGNSQHPNYDVSAGETFLYDIYNALRSGPGWNATLLIVTYDEHGGNYDHVAPPTNATPPGDGTVGEFGFDFSRFGVRVPAVLVSPWIEAGTVFHGDGPIDHTSVLKTISDRWGTAPLTNRDRAAASLGDVLTLGTPRTDDPLKATTPPPIPPAAATPGGDQQTSKKPSRMQVVQAEKVAALTTRDASGFFEESQPDLSGSDAVDNFITERTALWERGRRNRQS